MNLSTLQTQLRDYGRWFWIHILNRLIFVLIVEVFFYCAPRFLGIDLDGGRSPILASYFLLAVLPAFPFNDTTRSWYVSMGFTSPISSFQLVVVPLVLSVIVTLASFLIPASLVIWASESQLPLAGPSALVVCAMCCLFASASAASTVVGRWIGTALLVAVMFGLYLLLLSQSSQGLTASGEAAFLEFWEFSWVIYLGIALVTATAIFITFLGVNCRRYGESILSVLNFPRLVFSEHGNSVRNRVVSTRLSNKPFRNQWTTQCWYDFRKIKRVLLLPILFFPLVIIGFVMLGNYFDPGTKETFYILACSLVLCPFLSQFCAAVALRPPSAAVTPELRNQFMACPMAVFDATCPIRCDHLVAIKLLLVAAWSLVSVLIMAAVSLLYLRFIGDWEAVMAVGESLLEPFGQISVYWWIAASVSGLLLLICSATIWLALSNLIHVVFQPRVLICLCVFGFITTLLVLVDSFSDLTLRSAWLALGYLLAVGVVISCLIGLKQSLGSGLLCSEFLGVTISIWVLFTCAMIAMAIKIWPVIPAATPFLVYVFAGIGILIPLVSATAAPLGLAQQRHG